MNPHLRKTVKKAMVKKRGSTAIAKLAQKKKLFENPSQIQDEKFKDRFNKKMTWIQNMRATDLKEMYGESLPEDIAAKAQWTLPKLSEDELAIVKKLIATHGESNFKKMSFDRKVNLLQWTEDQCEKKVNLLLKDNRVHVCEEMSMRLHCEQ